ncbi:MAG: HAD hydrolase family protein [Ferruginibacter sp.]
MQANFELEDFFKGDFVSSPVVIRQKMRQVKAFIFDWDGVFNDGRKNLEGHSSFSEVDSMGVNMMRFSHFLLNKTLPIMAIITGENNQLAYSFAKREHFHFVYHKVLHKETALQHLCKQHNISPADVMFVYDDILDLSVAKLAGVKFMIGRSSNPMLLQYATENRLVDYITDNDGSMNAVREVSELIMAFYNNFNLAVDNRTKFSEVYKAYLELKNKETTQFFTSKDNEIIQS